MKLRDYIGIGTALALSIAPVQAGQNQEIPLGFSSQTLSPLKSRIDQQSQIRKKELGCVVPFAEIPLIDPKTGTPVKLVILHSFASIQNTLRITETRAVTSIQASLSDILQRKFPMLSTDMFVKTGENNEVILSNSPTVRNQIPLTIEEQAAAIRSALEKSAASCKLPGEEA